jgi:hypothetical protein
MQVGLFGLAAMLLLVALANIIMERARLADASAGSNSSAHVAGASSGGNGDPLADMGVIPSPAPPTASRTGNGGHSAAAR